MNRLAAVTVIAGALIVSSCGIQPLKSEPIEEPAISDEKGTPETFVFTDGSVEYENVVFGFDPEWIERVEVSVMQEDKLLEEDRKPDGVGGRTVDFVLKYRNSNDRALISVFKIAEYREAFARFPQYVERRDQDFEAVIKKPLKSKRWGIEEPVHVRWMDAHHDFYAKAGVVNFHRGSGLLMLTQIGQDAYTIINNKQLEYFFQGLTNDGIYFVEMSFPADMDGLPADVNSDSLVRYGLPKECCHSKPEYRDLYDKYKLRLAQRIDTTPDGGFKPAADVIREFVKSFRIN